MRTKITLAVIGCGAFADFFIELYKKHPDVEKVYVCDIIKERQNAFCKKFNVEGIDSFEEALKNKKINAIAIFTQRHLHGKMAVDALYAGKHVYSAVPSGISVEEIMAIEEAVRKTGLIYHTGETGYYRACTCLCRDGYVRGAFGDFVYGESQYNHDMRNMYGSYKHSGGEKWTEVAGFPPTYYPTHSTAMILGCMPGAYIKKVSAMGFIEREDRDIFGTDGQNLWNNPFTNTAMLCDISNGGVARISENRRVCWAAPESYISQFYGTKRSYEFSVAHHYLSKWEPCDDLRADGKKPQTLRDITDVMLPESVVAALKANEADGVQKIANGAGFLESSPIQPTGRLPESFRGLENGHNGCHHFMVDDFCKAVAENKLSPTNIWQAARFNIPGIIAFESALHGGVLMDVPDLGEPPAEWEMLNPDGVYGTDELCAKVLEV